MEDINKIEFNYGKERTQKLIKIAMILDITLIELMSKINKDDDNEKKGSKIKNLKT